MNSSNPTFFLLIIATHKKKKQNYISLSNAVTQNTTTPQHQCMTAKRKPHLKNEPTRSGSSFRSLCTRTNKTKKTPEKILLPKWLSFFFWFRFFLEDCELVRQTTTASGRFVRHCSSKICSAR